jgi:hypothetical protein
MIEPERRIGVLLQRIRRDEQPRLHPHAAYVLAYYEELLFDRGLPADEVEVLLHSGLALPRCRPASANWSIARQCAAYLAAHYAREYAAKNGLRRVRDRRVHAALRQEAIAIVQERFQLRVPLTVDNLASDFDSGRKPVKWGRDIGDWVELYFAGPEIAARLRRKLSDLKRGNKAISWRRRH